MISRSGFIILFSLFLYVFEILHYKYVRKNIFELLRGGRCRGWNNELDEEENYSHRAHGASILVRREGEEEMDNKLMHKKISYIDKCFEDNRENEETGMGVEVALDFKVTASHTKDQGK